MFVPNPQRPRALLIGDGDRLDEIISFAGDLEDARLQDISAANWKPLVLIELTSPITFRPRPSTILVPGMPEGTIACVPMLDECGIASRLASGEGYPGCYEGSVSELAAKWLTGLDRSALNEVAVFAWGSAALLEAAADLARRFELPCQPSAGAQITSRN